MRLSRIYVNVSNLQLFNKVTFHLLKLLISPSSKSQISHEFLTEHSEDLIFNIIINQFHQIV